MSRAQIGIRLKELRGNTTLSQEAFANKIGMSRSYYAECETGKRNISFENLEKIIAGHEMTPQEFFDSPTFQYQPKIAYSVEKLK